MPRSRKRRRNAVPGSEAATPGQRWTIDAMQRTLLRRTQALRAEKVPRLAKLRAQAKALRAQRAALPERAFHARADLTLELERLAREEARTTADAPFEEFAERAQPFLHLGANGDRGRVVGPAETLLFVNIFNRASLGDVTTFVNDARCGSCDAPLLFSTTDSMLVCASCGTSRHSIDKKAEQSGPGWRSNSVYKRTPLYQKYLRQFVAGTKKPPPAVIDLLYTALNHTHAYSIERVRATPVASVLRASEHKNWVSHTAYLVKTLRGEPCPVLTEAHQTRLVTRFRLLSKMFTKMTQSRQKIMSFEYLTNQFLHMEGEPRLAAMFSCHKTRGVLDTAHARMQQYCKPLAEQHPDMNWHVHARGGFPTSNA